MFEPARTLVRPIETASAGKPRPPGTSAGYRAVDRKFRLAEIVRQRSGVVARTYILIDTAALFAIPTGALSENIHIGPGDVRVSGDRGS